MKTAVVTDSNSGITKEEADRLGIFLLPMPVIIDEQHIMKESIWSNAFFMKVLIEGHDVSTSQPSPVNVMDMWKQILSKGYDEIIHIPMSSGLSSSCATAIGLGRGFPGKGTGSR